MELQEPFCDSCGEKLDMKSSMVMLKDSLRCIRCHKEHERALLSALVFADSERKDAYIKKLKIHRSAKITREPGCCCVII